MLSHLISDVDRAHKVVKLHLKLETIERAAAGQMNISLESLHNISRLKPVSISTFQLLQPSII